MSAKKKEAVVSDSLELKAMSLEESRIRRLTFEPEVAKKSCTAALSFVEEHAKEIEKQYPGFDLDSLRQLPTICDRLSAVQRKIEVMRTAQIGSSAALVAETLEWRRRLLAMADALAAVGKVNANELARIRTGLGINDNVRDVVDLVVLMTGHEAAVDATTSIVGALEKAAAIANETLTKMNVADNREIQRQAGLRDRYATLALDGRDRLRLVVSAISSEEKAAEMVPAFRSRGTRRSTEHVESSNDSNGTVDGHSEPGGVESSPEPDA